MIARYQHDYFANSPALTRNQVGKGQAIYLGTAGGEQLYETLVDWLCNPANHDRPSVSAEPATIEIVRRWCGEASIWFCLNHSGEPQTITIRGHLENRSDGTVYHDQTIRIPGYDVLILSSASPATG